MFNFGNSEDTAALFLQTRLQMTGPGMPEGHLDELSEKDARIVMAYLYGAVSAALREGLGDAEVKVLVTWYDDICRAPASSGRQAPLQVSCPRRACFGKLATARRSPCRESVFHIRQTRGHPSTRFRLTISATMRCRERTSAVLTLLNPRMEQTS